MAALAIAIAMGMGVGTIAAEDDPDDELHSIIDRTDPENASSVQVETVQEWATDEQLEQLNESQRDRVGEWLEDTPEIEDDGPANYTVAIDSETYITDWEFRDGQFVVDIYAENPTTVTMAESADWEEGEGEYRTMREDLDEGENVVYVPTFAGEDDGVALSFATELSMQEERGPYISTGTEAAEDPFRHFGGTSGLFSGVAMTTLLAAVGGWYVVRTEETGVNKA
ncbi:hypothetical protein C446_17896 [Halobiforma nitratireducens JCM 10879]|uniref:Uncharacterized protein n=1 Tax=Halobiforma nitratireducens JCM 10879 TaxID=1227454 RepID=M0L183_9EURY|nr:hypothetical protein C446_17896 [Halobiforma nitratireducens JCM 10879]